MQEIAIISDIHANLEAMTAVLDDIRLRHIEEIYCLGDVIGYGPNPIECMDLAISNCKVILMGNHEEGVIKGAFGVHLVAKEAINWTRILLKPGMLSFPHKRNRWKILQNLPVSYKHERFLLVHGSPRDPTYEYLLPADTEDLFENVPEKIKENLDLFEHLCFVGHSHKPGVITEKSKWYDPVQFDNIWEITPEKLICNVGSVGQPRDKDSRACYVTVGEKEICYHRIPYDFKKTQEKIKRISSLDNLLADRLEFGN